MSLSKQQIIQKDDLIRKLNPMKADYGMSDTIFLAEINDFLKLCKGKRVFYCESDGAYAFFFAHEGVLYQYSIMDKDSYSNENEECLSDTTGEIVDSTLTCGSSFRNKEKRDYSPCTKEYILSFPYSRYDERTLEDVIEQKINDLRKRDEWIDDDYISEIRIAFDKAVEDILQKMNDKITETKLNYDNKQFGEWIPTKEDIIRNHIYDIVNSIGDYFYGEIYQKRGLAFREKTEDMVRREAETIDLKNMTRKQKDIEIDKLYKKYNPTNNKDRYHITKKNIDYIFEDILADNKEPSITTREKYVGMDLG